MSIAIFVIISFVCALGWLVNWVGSAALAKWIVDKGYTPPTDQEMSQCVNYVWRKILKIK